MIVFQQTWMNSISGKHCTSMETSFLVYIINNLLDIKISDIKNCNKWGILQGVIGL